jgi:hypothetical protein
MVHVSLWLLAGKWREGEEYVRAMERIPPPAPARACATLSLCWAVVPTGGCCVDSAGFSCVA